MSSVDLSSLSATALVEVRNRYFDALEALHSDQQPPTPFHLWGLGGYGPSDAYTEPEKWIDECLQSLLEMESSALDEKVFRPLVIEYGIYGVRFIDKLFGTNVYLSDGNWWGDEIGTPIGDLKYPDLDSSEAWQLAMRATHRFLESGVKAPVFGLPTIASALNIAVNLYGETFLIALLTEPEAARHDLDVINSLLSDIHKWYLKTLPIDQLQPVVATQRTQPPGYGQICGCTCHLLSAAQYNDFIAPLDDALLSIYPKGGMIHLCGAHAQHIPTFRDMPSLKSVQLNDRAADDFELYLDGLRDDQVIYLNPTDEMTVENALKISEGKRTIFVAE